MEHPASLIWKSFLVLFLLFYVLPLGLSAFRYWQTGMGGDWRTADRTSARLLPPVSAPGAVIRVFCAPTVRWRSIFAVHCWIVLKPEGAAAYTRFDYTAWGDPVRRNGFEPDGRWFGGTPASVFAADGAAADAMIPVMLAAVEDYRFSTLGDYRAWPGPNSNTFVAAILDAVPGHGAVLPPNAIGKDFPYDDRWLRLTPSRTGLTLRLGGYAGLTVAWVEGLELNLLGAVAGLDLRRPALKLPGWGRIAPWEISR